jgi:hypothetical protein
MRVRYRVIEKWWPDSKAWEEWGAIYDNRSGRFRESKSLLISSLAESRATVREFERRIEALGLDVEHCQPLLEGHTQQFRFRSTIDTVEGETFREIHNRLWRQIFGPPWQESQPTEAPARVEYAARPAHRALRESDEAEDA